VCPLIHVPVPHAHVPSYPMDYTVCIGSNGGCNASSAELVAHYSGGGELSLATLCFGACAKIVIDSTLLWNILLRSEYIYTAFKSCASVLVLFFAKHTDKEAICSFHLHVAPLSYLFSSALEKQEKFRASNKRRCDFYNS
jgi:hypothetical protein